MTKKPFKLSKNARIAIAVIITLIIAYAAYFSFPENAVSHSFTAWEQYGSEVSVAKINTPVTLKLDIYSTSLLGFKGNIKIQIKKDLKLSTDSVIATKTIPINLPSGLSQKQAVSVTFTPSENTGAFSTVKGYFYKILTEDSKAIYDPQDPEMRNQLEVADKASGESFPTVTGILFNDKPQITVSPNSPISTIVKLTGKGSGILKLEIRKDFQYGVPDGESYITLTTNSLDFDGPENIKFPTWIAKEQSGLTGLAFREYFAKVYWNDNLIYDPTKPAEREYVKVKEGSSSSSPGDPEASGLITLKSVDWNIVPNSASSVKTTFRIDGTIDKKITVDIRRNIPFWSDNPLTSKSHSISGTDEDITLTTSFTAPNTGNWVFVRVPGIYDSDNPSERKAQGTEVQVSSDYQPPESSPEAPPNAPPTPPVSPIVSYNIVELKSNYGSGLRINVPQGARIDVYATVTSNTVTSGSLSVEVRKDISWSDDITLTTLSKQVTLTNGANTILMGSFTANDLSNSNNFRQYFFKTSWNNAVLNNPEDPNTRESVTTYTTQTPPVDIPEPTPQPTQIIQPAPDTPSESTGTLYVSDVGFGYNQLKSMTVNKNEPVPVYVRVTASGGPVYQQIKVEIRKDRQYGLVDQTYKILYPTVRTSEGTYWINAGTFYPDESTSDYGTVRQYFARIDINGDSNGDNGWEYNPDDPDTRAHVEVR